MVEVGACRATLSCSVNVLSFANSAILSVSWESNVSGLAAVYEMKCADQEREESPTHLVANDQAGRRRERPKVDQVSLTTPVLTKIG